MEKPFLEKYLKLGEELGLKIQFFDNGEGVVFMNQQIVLHGNFNDAQLCLVGSTLEPDTLRVLANRLDAEIILAQNKLNKKRKYKK